MSLEDASRAHAAPLLQLFSPLS